MGFGFAEQTGEGSRGMVRLTSVVTISLAAVMFAFPAVISIIGTWEGKENGLPSVEVRLGNKNGQISGTISFYFQTRGDDGKWHLNGNPFTVPILSPKLEGSVLRFETIHHREHDSPELGPNNKYRVTFLGPTQARLQVFRHGANEDSSAPGFILTRRN